MRDDQWEFDVDGERYIATIEVDNEDDCQKAYHRVKHMPSGCERSADLSPYDTNRGLVEMWVACGMPERSGVGPVSADDLVQMMVTRWDAVAGEHAEVGACDTEPRAQFREIIRVATRCGYSDTFADEFGALRWDLYWCSADTPDDERALTTANMALSRAAKDAFHAIAGYASRRLREKLAAE